MIQRLILDNGITAIIVENKSAEVIAGRIFLKNAGAREDSLTLAGLSHLVATVLTKGTKQFSSAEIAEEVESMGANLSADAAADYFLVSLKTVAVDFPQMLKLVGEILRSPTFPEPEIELEKRLIQQSIRSQQEQPFNVAFNQLRQAMYPAHPYGTSILGTEETVSQLSRADLKKYHQTYFRPDNLVISLAGCLELADAVHLIEKVFGNWEIPSSPFPLSQFPPLQTQPSEERITQDTQQSIVMLGYLGAAVKSIDYPVLKLLSTYLGNGLSSRLFVELREKRGLAYDVSAFYPTRLDSSQFVVYMGTAPENTAIAVEGLRQEVDRLCETELTPQELQSSKNKILGQYALGKQTNAEIAQILGWYESLGLGIEYDRQFPEQIAQITPQLAQQVACDYLRKPYLSLVGPAAAIQV